jgi:hypothetical protein
MRITDRRWRRALWILAVLGLTSCQRSGPTTEQARVTKAFDAWKTAVINHQPDRAMAYIPRHVDNYLATLNAPPPATPPTNAPPSPYPGVDLLLRQALEKKVPADLRAKLTLATLLQRITDRNLFNPRDVRELTLGPVTVNGDRASAQVYYDDTLTAVRLPFVKEDDTWKIDVMAVLPYAEELMKLDRAIKGETQPQQVDQLVAKLPSL